MGQNTSKSVAVVAQPQKYRLMTQENYKMLSEILDVSNQLIEKYKNQSHFLNSAFCKKIELTYSNQLKKLAPKDVTSIYNELFKGIENVIQVGDDKYEISAFGKELPPFGLDRQYTVEKDGIKVNYYLVGKQKSNRVVGGNTKRNKLLKNIIDNLENNNDNVLIKQNVKNVKNKPNVFINKPVVEVVKNNKPNVFIKKPVVEVVKNKPNVFIEKPIVEVVKNNKTMNVGVNANVKENKGLYKECNETKCVLTKYEVCRKIVSQYLYRLNILQAIYHVLPNKISDNKYFGSFYYNRILSLRIGNMCLPRDIGNFKKSTTEEKIRILNKILQGNALHPQRDQGPPGCRELYKDKYTEEDIIKLKGNSDFAKKHALIQDRLEGEYIKSIETLYKIVDRLKTDLVINNNELYELGELTKKTIEDMYYNAQFNYVIGIINYIHYNM